ncbi:unnamed protein product [Periconia digitata]|uniref:Uncharacterized protein n=1 Tax=Periconia digitata TaxID=1303443 RepID=A0A9W4XV31_9PLEO|nr:unnamed protein product [Periconia digitata]
MTTTTLETYSTTIDESKSQVSQHSDPFHYDHDQQITGVGLARSTSPSKRFSVCSTDEDIISPTSEIPMSHYLSIDNWPQPVESAHNVASSVYTLPETVKVSPFVLGAPFEDTSSNSASKSSQSGKPQDIGWDFVKDSPKVTKMPPSENALKIHIPEFAYTPAKKVAKSGKNTETRPSMPTGPKQSPQATSTLANIYHDAKEIYLAGPKGDGHDLWHGIQQLRKPHKAAHPGHAPVTKPKSNPPSRPSEPEPLGIIRRPVQVTHEATVDTQPPSLSPIRVPRPPANNIRRSNDTEAVETGSTNSSPVFTIEVGASPTVQQDAQETIINYTKPKQAPQLQPAPKTRKEFRRQSTTTKFGLPPPPVPKSPRSGKGNYVVIGAEGTHCSSKEEKPSFLLPLPHTKLQLDSSSAESGNISKLDISYPQIVHLPSNTNSKTNIAHSQTTSSKVHRPASNNKNQNFSSLQIPTHPSNPHKRHHQRTVSAPLQKFTQATNSLLNNDKNTTSRNSSGTKDDARNTRRDKTNSKTKAQIFWSDVITPAMTSTASKLTASRASGNTTSTTTTTTRKRKDSDTSFSCQGLVDDNHDDFVGYVRNHEVEGRIPPTDVISRGGEEVGERGQESSSGASISSLRPKPLFFGIPWV